MNQLCTRIALRLAGNAACRSLSAGLALGLLFWLICSLHPGDAFRGAMALVLLLAGAASYLLFALATAPQEVERTVRVAQIRQWIVALSLGVLAAVNGLEWMFA